MATPGNMYNDTTIKKAPETPLHYVRRAIQAGFSREKTFERAVLRFSDRYLSAKTVKEWLKQIDDGDSSNLPETHKPLLQLVFSEYQRAERAIQAQSCPSAWHCRLEMLTWRYAIDIEEENRNYQSLVAFDLLHGAQRKIDVEGMPEIYAANFKIAVLNPERILFITLDRPSLTTVHLINLDIVACKAKVLDTFLLEGQYMGFLPNHTDQNRFFIKTLLQNDLSLSVGRVVDDKKLEFEEAVLDSGFMLTYSKIKVEGDTIFGFKYTNVNGRDIITYDEIPLNPYSQLPITLCEMKSDEYIEYQEMERANYYWYKNACYVLARMENLATPVYKFDLETQRITCILENIHYLSVKDFRVDDDEILSVCSEFSHKKQHVLHRFSLRQPEKLTLLSLMSIRNNILMFTTEQEYNVVISKLPAEVRPFTNSLSLH